MASIRIDEALQEATKRLKDVSERPLYEAQLLLAHYLKKDRVFLHTHPEFAIEPKGYFEMIQRRAAFEPIEYITGRVSFYAQEFLIEPGVLIPRPETELLIDNLVPFLKGDEKLLEIGVGSGIISTVLKQKFPDLKITATDINPKAIDLAKRNFEKFGVDVELRLTDMAQGISDHFDVIVSNPPYIKKDFPLPKNVVEYEPKEALIGGERGDEMLERIIDLFLDSKAKILACEMGYDQRASVEKYLQDKEVEIFYYKDLSKLDRGFIARKK